MRKIMGVPRFTKGVITDRRGVAGALLEARDAIPLRGGEVWSVRRGLFANKMTTGDAPTGGIRVFSTDSTWFKEALVLQGLALVVLGGVERLMPISAGGAGGTFVLGDQALNHGGAAIAFTGVTNKLTAPNASSYADAMQYQQELWTPGTWNAKGGVTNLPMRWAGNATGTQANGGTVAGTVGQSTITGTTTAFAAAQEGCYIYINAGTVNERMFRITRVISATSIAVDAPLGATFAGVGYRISRNCWWSVQAGTFGGGNATTGVSALVNTSYLNARCAAPHKGRVFAGNTIDNDPGWFPSRVRWSYPFADVSGQWRGAERWHTNAYVDVEPGVGGDDGIRAVISNGVDLLVFKENMVFAVRGDVESDGRDIGAKVERVLETDGLDQGWPIATPDGIVFIGKQGLYRIGQGTIENLTEKGGVQRLFQLIQPKQVGYVDSRLFLHGSTDKQAAITQDRPNVMIFDTGFGVWYTMQSWLVTPPLKASGNIVSVINAAEALGVGGYAVTFAKRDKDTDDILTDVPMIYPNDIATALPGVEYAVCMRLITHALPLGREINARLRGIQVRGQFGPSAELTKVTARVLVGEDGNEAAIVSLSSDPDPVQQGATWQRIPVRNGTPITPDVRVQIDQEPVYVTTNGRRCRLHEMGVEYVSVGRTR